MMAIRTKTRTIHRLSAIKVSKAPAGKYCDGNGLWLIKTDRHSGRWAYRYQFEGKSHEIGLGSIQVFSLEETRKKALELRKLQKSGIDPLVQRRATATRKKLDEARAVSFEECANAYIKTHRAKWGDVNAQQWENTFRDYVFPIVGSLPVAEIDTGLIVKIFTQEIDGTSFWLARSVTAGRLRGRIENVLDYARTCGHRTGENPCRWRGHLENLLPARSSVQKVKNHLAAMPYSELPSFMKELREQDSIESLALQFTILCASRVGESLNAEWSEVNLEAGTWVIPAGRMKAGREHTVPLSARAIEILEIMKGKNAVYVFPGQRTQTLPDKRLRELLITMKRDVTVHGFRSTFSDWANECTEYPTNAIEINLSHKVGSDVELAYRRGDLRERRRALLADWATFCASARPHLTLVSSAA